MIGTPISSVPQTIPNTTHPKIHIGLFKPEIKNGFHLQLSCQKAETKELISVESYIYKFFVAWTGRNYLL